MKANTQNGVQEINTAKIKMNGLNDDKNEFDDENMDELKLDLFELIQSENNPKK